MAGPLLYAPVSDLREWISGTDGGAGTAAKLTDAQLTLALQAATNRCSIYIGNVFDSSSPQAVPPPALHDLTLDLAAFWAFKNLLKNKEMGQNHPVIIAYKDAMKMLQDARDGKIRLDPAIPGSVGDETGVIINRLPNIFTDADSGTRYNPIQTQLEADTSTPDFWSPSLLDDTGFGGAIYQG